MFVFTTCSPCTVNNHAPVTSTKHLSSLFLPTLLVVQGWEGGGHSHMAIVTTATAVKILTINFSQFDCWLDKILGFWPFWPFTETVGPFGVSCMLQTPSAARWHLWQLEGTSFAQCRLHCGNKSVMIGLLQVSCTCNLLGSTVKSSLVPRPLTR